MKSLNSTVEQAARDVVAGIEEPDRVRVKVKVSWRGLICLPDKNGEFEEEAVFVAMTVGDHLALDKASSYDVEIGDNVKTRRTTIRATDLNEYKRLLVKRNLLAWTLDIPVERVGGWMTPECYERVSRVPAPLLEAFVDGFESSVEVTEAEERKINRQCAVLFGRDSRGVSDACEAVSLFCTLGNFWEKFGLDKEKLPRMPYKEYLLLKMMMGNEGESMRRTHSAKGPAVTKIAGAGGRTRPSRGISMPM